MDTCTRVKNDTESLENNWTEDASQSEYNAKVWMDSSINQEKNKIPEHKLFYMGATVTT